MQRRIALQKRGPREKNVTDRRQGELTFDPVEASLSPKYQSCLTTKFWWKDNLRQDSGRRNDQTDAKEYFKSVSGP
jgi:hypothetical protein